MKEKRIRIVAKERQVMDIGKFVLALVGIAGVPNVLQLSLPLGDERPSGSTPIALRRSSEAKSRVASNVCGSRAQAGAQTQIPNQLALPLEVNESRNAKEVA